MKRLTAVLSPGYRAGAAESDVRWIIEFAAAADLVRFGADGQARVTPKWKTWEKRSAVTRLKDALNHAIHVATADVSAFHSQA